VVARGAVCLALAALLAAPAWGAPSQVDALLARSERDPEGARRGLSELAARKLEPAERLEVDLAWPLILERCGQASRARAAWRQLLAEGIDVASELLRLEGARLEVHHGPTAPGSRPTIELRGRRTGPVALRLYRVDSTRFRDTIERARGLFAHLNAPPPAALTKLAQWSVPALVPGTPARTAAPVQLSVGLYLLVVEARGVARPIPLHVSGTAALVRRGSGKGLVWLVERATGLPIPRLALEAHDALGRPLAKLGVTGWEERDVGVLRYEGDAPWAIGWRGADLVRVRLLPQRPLPEAPNEALWTDLPRYRAGAPLHARRLEGRVPLKLLTPDGLVWASAQEPVLIHRLPPWAPSGRWEVRAGRAGVGVWVDPPDDPDVRLEVEFGEGALRLRASVRGGFPLRGRRVRYALQAWPAAPTWEGDRARPLAPHAPRRTGEGPRMLASGEVVLDGHGTASVPLPPRGSRWTVLRAQAWLEDGALRARAQAQTNTGPKLALQLTTGRRLVRPNQVIPVRLVAIDRRGERVPRQAVILRAGPGRGSKPWIERSLRTNERGSAETSLSLNQRGPASLEVLSPDRSATARAALWLSDPPAARPAERLELLLGRQKATSTAALGLLPFARGATLLTAEGRRVLSTRTYSVMDAQLPLLFPLPPPPGGRFALHVFHGDAWQREAVDLEAGPDPLDIRVHTSQAQPGGEVPVRVVVRRRSRSGSLDPVASRLLITLHPVGTARWLDRAPTAHAAVTGVRGEGEVDLVSVAQVASGTFRTLAADLGSRTSKAGAGQVTLRAPTATGRYWVRVEARDAMGGRGVAWAATYVRAPLRLAVTGPAHLVEGDASQLVIEFESEREAPLTLRWKVAGLAFDAPQIQGTRPRLEGDPGAAALALLPTRRARVVLPFRAPKPGRFEVHLEAKRGDEQLRKTFAFDVHVGGLPESTHGSGVIQPGRRRTRVTLTAPTGLVPMSASLHVCVDPEPLTALLAGLAELERAPGLLARLEAASVRRLLRVLWLRRRIGLSYPAGGASWDETRRCLIAARDASGGWGSETLDLGLALGRLVELGVRVPAPLLLPARETARTSSRPEAPLALALLDGPPAGIGPAPAEAGARVYWAAASGSVAAVASAIPAPADPALPLLPAAHLLEGLLSRPRPDQAQVRATLFNQLFAAREGAGWRDVRVAGAALRSLLQRALADKELEGVRIETRLEGRVVRSAYAGGGLADWPSPLQRQDPLVTRGTRLEFRVRGAKQPLPYSWQVEGRVRLDPKNPPRVNGLRIARRRTPPGPLRPGQRFTIQIDVADLTGHLPPEVLLELPLPGGCRLLRAPPDAVVERGLLLLPVRSTHLSLEFLAHLPGTYRALPVRARSHHHWGVSAEDRIIVAE
jgi:hypothetical protein